MSAMSRTLRRSFATLAAAASLQALLPGGSAQAQGVRIFEEAPSLEVLRSIIVPESRPGLGRRIVIGNPDRPAPLMAPETVGFSDRSSDAAPAPSSPPRRAQPAESGPMMAAARAPAPAPAAAPATAMAMPVSMPAPRPRETSETGIVGFRINFALNSDVVPQSAYAFVDRIGELMREQPEMKMQVEGHTDALGSDEYNLLLSMRRAAAVANHLVKRYGIEPARLVVLGKGEAEPLAQNPFDAGNRRVQFLRAE